VFGGGSWCMVVDVICVELRKKEMKNKRRIVMGKG
jgi:hypothetical protein